MIRLASVILLLLVSCSCASDDQATDDPIEEAAELQTRALEAMQAGRLGESQRLLEEFLERFSENSGAGEAESLFRDVRVASEARALQGVRDVYQAQANFMSLNRRYALTLQELVEASTLAEDPSLGDSGYQIRMRPSPNADRFALTAEPIPGADSKRSFFVDETGIVRWVLGQPATADSQELELSED